MTINNAKICVCPRYFVSMLIDKKSDKMYI